MLSSAQTICSLAPCVSVFVRECCVSACAECLLWPRIRQIQRKIQENIIYATRSEQARHTYRHHCADDSGARRGDTLCHVYTFTYKLFNQQLRGPTNRLPLGWQCAEPMVCYTAAIALCCTLARVYAYRQQVGDGWSSATWGGRIAWTAVTACAFAVLCVYVLCAQATERACVWFTRWPRSLN